MVDTLRIQNAAYSVLNNLGRTSFSGDGFSKEQIDSIAEAITSAIVAYDEQNHSQES